MGQRCVEVVVKVVVVLGFELKCYVVCMCVVFNGGSMQLINGQFVVNFFKYLCFGVFDLVISCGNIVGKCISCFEQVFW